MKRSFLLLFAFICSVRIYAQVITIDSLQGFDVGKAFREAYEKQIHEVDIKAYVNNAKRAYVNRRFHLDQPPLQSQPLSKYGSGTTNFLPCMNEDFETSPLGLLGNNPLYTATDQTILQSYVCTTTLIPMYTNTSAVVVYSTPLLDLYCGTVGNSPFGGTKVAKINDNGLAVGRLKQAFPVSPTSWIYNYAYVGALAEWHNGCCMDAYLMFRFYDIVTGAPLSSLNHTIVMGTASCVPTSTVNWVVGGISPGGVTVNVTPKWQVFSMNLSSYIGTGIVVEVIAGGCITGAHPGYMYYDAQCTSNGAVIVNGDYAAAVSSYTSCTNPATLSALPGFTNCVWKGPAGSGISNATTTAVTASTSGIYTLTASSGTLNYTYTLNLTMIPNNASIAGSNTLCVGETATLQVSGSGWNSYAWSNGSTLQTTTVNPPAASSYTYSVIATNTLLGCVSAATKTITVIPLPILSLVSSVSGICLGKNATLSAGGPAGVTFAWSTGASGSSISVSPTSSTSYTVTGTATTGCKSSLSAGIVVHPLPTLQVTAAPPSMCIGQTAVLTASTLTGNTYSWSTGATSPVISVSPTLNSVYSVTITDNLGCSNSGTQTITVNPLPQIQVIASHTEICLGQTASYGVIGSNISSVSWNTGSSSLSFTVSPSLNSVYSVTATSVNGCISSQSASLLVNALPQPQIISSNTSICVGESATLSVNGSNIASYQWGGNNTASLIVVFPAAATDYSVTVTDLKGCTASTGFHLEVNTCTGIGTEHFKNKGLTVLPNPNEGTFEIKGSQTEKVLLFNDLGQLIVELQLCAENNYTGKITNLAKGIYFIKSTAGSEKIIIK